jgi:hypothetical protein
MKKLIPFIIIGAIAIPIFVWANGLGVYVGAGKGTTLGLYHMEGTSTDASGNNRTGTPVGTQAYVATSTCQFGTKAIRYVADLSSTKVASTTFPFGTTAWTISLWFRFVGTTQDANGSTLIGQTNGTVTHGFQIAPNINGPNTLDMDAIGQWSLIYPWTPDTKCHNLIVVGSGSGVTMYLDGKQATSTTATAAIITGSGLIGFGCTIQSSLSCRSTSGASTTMDEVIFANNSWTAQNVYNYYSWAKGRRNPNTQ